MGGRSGNRGQCAQPCRRLYSLIDDQGNYLKKDSYLLSLRDLNLSAHLGEIIDAGIHSFKIEGRLKDKAYVMNIVAYYRQTLDRLREEKAIRPCASGRVHIDFNPDPHKTFNRDFTTYFLHGRNTSIAAAGTPKSTGELMGRIVSLQKRSFQLDMDMDIDRGDGLCFFTPQGELTGTSVQDVQGKAIFPEKMDGLVVGTVVYRNYNRKFLLELQRNQAVRKIDLRFRLYDTPTGLGLEAQDEDGILVNTEIPCKKPHAAKPEVVLPTFEKQLSKLGGTPFTAVDLHLELNDIYFIPVSLLNTLRRQSLDALLEERERKRPRFTAGLRAENAHEIPSYPQKSMSYTGNVLNTKARGFYIRHGVEEISPAAESGLDMHGKKVMTTKYCLKYELGCCPKKNRDTRLKEPLFLIDEGGNRFQLRFNCAACEMEVYF